MAKNKQFSVVLPTYSGQRTIDRTFESLLAQPVASLKYEVIVVIDGPSPEIREKVSRFQEQFLASKVNFKIVQFTENKGRFAARVAGAKGASFDQLLFLEDRVYLADDYFDRLAKQPYKLMLSNVLEDKTNSNFIADTLTLIRRAVYGRGWGQSFRDYDIDLRNFEKAPKGMASLWIEKKLFLEACEEFSAGQTDTRSVSDDTGVLRLVVEKGNAIRRVSGLKIYYQPRTGLGESIRHLYQRGPKFVDYYLRPGTRFFYLIAIFYLALVAVIALAILKPALLWLILAGYILAVLALVVRTVRNIRDLVLLMFGLPLVGVVFFSGVISGSYSMVTRNRR